MQPGRIEALLEDALEKMAAPAPIVPSTAAPGIATQPGWNSMSARQQNIEADKQWKQYNQYHVQNTDWQRAQDIYKRQQQGQQLSAQDKDWYLQNYRKVKPLAPDQQKWYDQYHQQRKAFDITAGAKPGQQFGPQQRASFNAQLEKNLAAKAQAGTLTPAERYQWNHINRTRRQTQQNEKAVTDYTAVFNRQYYNPEAEIGQNALNLSRLKAELKPDYGKKRRNLTPAQIADEKNRRAAKEQTVAYMEEQLAAREAELRTAAEQGDAQAKEQLGFLDTLRTRKHEAGGLSWATAIGKYHPTALMTRLGTRLLFGKGNATAYRNDGEDEMFMPKDEWEALFRGRNMSVLDEIENGKHLAQVNKDLDGNWLAWANQILPNFSDIEQLISNEKYRNRIAELNGGTRNRLTGETEGARAQEVAKMLGYDGTGWQNRLLTTLVSTPLNLVGAQSLAGMAVKPTLKSIAKGIGWNVAPVVPFAALGAMAPSHAAGAADRFYELGSIPGVDRAGNMAANRAYTNRMRTINDTPSAKPKSDKQQMEGLLPLLLSMGGQGGAGGGGLSQLLLAGLLKKQQEQGGGLLLDKYMQGQEM